MQQIGIGLMEISFKEEATSYQLVADVKCDIIGDSVVECWISNYTTPNYDIWGSYENEIQSMKEWQNARLEWLKREFDKM